MQFSREKILVSLDKLLHTDNRALIPWVSNSRVKNNYVLRLFSILEINIFGKSVETSPTCFPIHDHAPVLQ